MSFLLALCFRLLPVINAWSIVKIHRNAVYHPHSWCSFLSNASLADDASLQTCIRRCTQQLHCRTVVFHNDGQNCSMFAELVRLGHIVSSGDVRASVIALIENRSQYLRIIERSISSLVLRSGGSFHLQHGIQ